jgi:hypothetical protein
VLKGSLTKERVCFKKLNQRKAEIVLRVNHSCIHWTLGYNIIISCMKLEQHTTQEVHCIDAVNLTAHPSSITIIRDMGTTILQQQQQVHDIKSDTIHDPMADMNRQIAH